MTTPKSSQLIRILLIDDEEASFKNLAEALGYPPPIKNVQSSTTKLPSNNVLELREVSINKVNVSDSVQLTWLRTPVPITNLIDFLVMCGRDYHLIAYDLAWADNDPITGEEIKAMKSHASVVWRMRSEQAGPGAYVLYQLQDTHDPGREILSRLVLYSYHIESEGRFIPSPRLREHVTDQSDEQTQRNALGDEFLGHLDFLGLIGKSSDLGAVGIAVGKALGLASKVCPTATAPQSFSSSELIGPRLNEFLKQKKLENIARHFEAVLVRGETGTGKEGVARAIHNLSNRKSGPFIAVNCGALSETLLESELFGHIKGAFTGAESSKLGKFKAADGGVIFLDEINSASPMLQVKLLRVLQERKFEPVGSDKTESVDVVVIAASNASLEDLVTKGQFRNDLYYRLGAISIDLPPLYERADDIPALAEHFLAQFNQGPQNTVAVCLDCDAIKIMQEYNWPGNVRELKTCVERCAFYCTSGRITANDVLAFVADEKKRWGFTSIRSSAAEPQLPEPPRTVTPKQLRDWIVGVARVHSVLIAKQHGKTLLENGWSDIETGTRKKWLELLDQIDTASAEDFENHFVSKTKARSNARDNSSD